MSSSNQEYTIINLNTLAYSKGNQPICELTGQPAGVKIVSEHITLFYAKREHAEQSWHGIM